MGNKQTPQTKLKKHRKEAKNVLPARKHSSRQMKSTGLISNQIGISLMSNVNKKARNYSQKSSSKQLI